MKKIVSLFVFLVTLTVAGNAQTDSLQQYAGRYVFPAGTVVEEVNVSLKDTTLSITSSAGNSILVRQQGDNFSMPAFSGTVVFKRDTNKNVVGISIDAMGYQLEGTKDQPKALVLAPSDKILFKREQQEFVLR